MPVPTKFFFDLKLPSGDPVTVEVTAEPEQQKFIDAGLEGMVSILEDLASDARKKGAASRFDLEDFGSDSAYLDAVDALADRIGISAIRRAGEQKLFNVDAHYEDDQPWNDDVMAVDASDAEFQAAWIMALGSGSSADSAEDFNNLVATIDDFEIFWATPAKPDPDELTAVLARLYSAVESGETEEAMTEARQVLEKLEALPAPAITPAP